MSSPRLLLATAAVLLLTAANAIAAPANDSRSTPQIVAPNGQTVNGTTVGATVAAEDTEAPGTGTHSVWYRWTAPQNGYVTMTSHASSMDPVVAVYHDGSNCCPFRQDLDSGNGNDAQVGFYVRSGQPYEILVDGETAADIGTFTLAVAFDSTPSAPFNDDFMDADDLGTGTSASRASVNGLFADDETFEPSHRGLSTSHSLWYRWTPAKSGGARVHVPCGYGASDPYGTANSVVAIYTGNSVAALNQVIYTDTWFPGDCSYDWVQFHAVAGVTYRIAADAGAGQIGESSLSLTQDVVAPTVNFGDSAIYGPNQKVTFGFSENAHAKCKLDGGAETSCGNGEFQLVNAASGNHKLEVRPTDYYGNPGVWTAKTFAVTTAPPQTDITAGPPADLNKADAQLAFTSSKGGSTFECRYGNKPWFACNGGSYVYKYSYAPSVMDVTFEVRAIDNYGNADPTPAARTWTYDFAGPKLVFPYTSPQAASGQPLTWSWTSDEKATFACSIDGSAFAPCTSPHSVPGITTAGNRTLRVQATDAAGNMSEYVRTGYQQGPPRTATTPTTTATGTATSTGTTGVRTTTAPRFFLTLRAAVRSISHKRLASKGLAFDARCRPSCVMTVRLVTGRSILATVRTRSRGTLKLGAAAKRVLKKVRKGSALSLVAVAPGTTTTQRIRIAG